MISPKMGEKKLQCFIIFFKIIDVLKIKKF